MIMTRLFPIAAILLIVISGCAYRFDAAELEYIEFHESTNITDWDEGIFEKSYKINFKIAQSDDEYTVGSDELAQNITAIINKFGLQLGLYARNESCNISNREEGLAIIQYRLGTITIEEDFCNPHTTSNQVYLMIKDLDFLQH